MISTARLVLSDLPYSLSALRHICPRIQSAEARCSHFKEVPTEADVYSLKMILHDWNDCECTRILETIRRRAKPDGRIFVVEHIVPGPSESHFSKLFDIHMMCWGSGRERTEAEYASLLEASGWRFVTCRYPSHASMGVVEGVAV
jgi:hypothetical protein